jgi:hypothetical protein
VSPRSLLAKASAIPPQPYDDRTEWCGEQFTLLYNAIYNGPAREVDASQLRQLQSQFGVN